jgi:hypothetical protein
MCGRSRCKRGSPDFLEFAAWRRQIFVRVAVLILYICLLLFADFSYPYRSSSHLTLSVSLFRGSEKSARLCRPAITISGTLRTRSCALAARTNAVRALAWRTKNAAHYCDTYTNFASVQLQLANQVNPIYLYIESVPT